MCPASVNSASKRSHQYSYVLSRASAINVPSLTDDYDYPSHHLPYCLSCLTAGCSESGAHRAGRIEPLLTEAGFRVTTADTTARREALSSLTPLKVQYFE